MAHFAVIDTETTYSNEVMSIGVVIADDSSFTRVDGKYYIVEPACYKPAMYADELDYVDADFTNDRNKVIRDLKDLLDRYGVTSIFAYNASFDRSHLPELHQYDWFDIMRIAANRNYNSAIPVGADCYSNGKLKRGYGVEPMLRMLDVADYTETHNAYNDALDELKIMRCLGISVNRY